MPNNHRTAYPPFIHRCLTVFAALLFSLSLAALDGVSMQQPPQSGNTYRVSTAEELAWIAQQSAQNTFEGYTIELQQSIDLGTNANWTPIGSATMPFQGTFEGRCHAIANLNINYITATQDIGLFGYIGAKGAVRELAIKSGKIFLDKKKYVGCIAGQNHGKIHYCFNLGQIVADESDTVGSLVGYNAGIIDHCYNAGIISAGGNCVGGLTGYNNGQVSNGYNIGYTKASGGNIGAVTGGNGGVFTNVYYDFQMCLQNGGADGVTGRTTLEMDDIFVNDADYTTKYLMYPQLTCFAQSDEKDLSFVSIVPATLKSDILPIQRAESVTKTFSLYINSDTYWYSSAPEVIEVLNSEAFVHRPCQKQEVLLQATYKGNVKKVYMMVEGFNMFDAGSISGNNKVCLNSLILFSDRNKGGEERTASGGKDDDAQNAPYYYRLRLYQLTDANGDGVVDTVPIKENTYTQQNYAKNSYIATDQPGKFLYKRDAHDSQCHPEWAESMGTFEYEVMDDFDAGEISSTTDTIYGGLPCDTTIISVQDAHGGGGPYSYRWYLTQQKVNYITGDTTDVIKDQLVQVGRNPVDTVSYRPQLTQPGEYVFTRTAHDSYCHNVEFAESQGVKRFVVFDTLYAGAVHSDSLHWCTIEAQDTIFQQDIPTGGNGRYLYRWLSNGTPIQGADSTFLPLAIVPFAYGQTYLLQREVKDDTGLMDWTLSEGEYKISIYAEFTPGAIMPSDDTVCLSTGTEPITIEAAEQAPAQGGEGEITYRWLLSRLRNNKAETLAVLDTNTVSYSHSFHIQDYPALSLPCTVVLTREVQNEACFEEWRPSEGEARVTIGKETRKKETVTVCQSELPYQGTYTYADGNETPYTLDYAGDSAVFNDQSAIGCPMTVTRVCKTIPTPAVEVEPIGAICQTDNVLTLYFNIIEGNPNRYAIDYSPNAIQTGFEPTEAPLDSRTELSLQVPTAPMGNYELYIRFFTEDKDHSCPSPLYTLAFSTGLPGYVHAKWNDVLFVDNNDKNGIPDAESDLKFTAYQWYKNGEPVEGATRQVYWEEGGLNGVYYVLLTDVSGNVYRSCDVEQRPLSPKTPSQEAIAVSPMPADAGAEMYIKATEGGCCEIFDLAGNLLCRLPIAQGINSLTAPEARGIFVLRFTDGQGKSISSKLIIK